MRVFHLCCNIRYKKVCYIFYMYSVECETGCWSTMSISWSVPRSTWRHWLSTVGTQQLSANRPHRRRIHLPQTTQYVPSLLPADVMILNSEMANWASTGWTTGKNFPSPTKQRTNQPTNQIEVFQRRPGLRGTVVEHRSLTGELSLSCAPPAAGGWPLTWVNHPL